MPPVAPGSLGLAALLLAARPAAAATDAERLYAEHCAVLPRRRRGSAASARR